MINLFTVVIFLNNILYIFKRNLHSFQKYQLLSASIDQFTSISSQLVQRAGVSVTPQQCQQRWQLFLNPERISLPQYWSQEQTQKLIKILQKYGPVIDKMSTIFVDRSKKQIKTKIYQILSQSIKNFQKLLWKQLHNNFGVITQKEIQQMIKMMANKSISQANSDVFLLRKHLLNLMQKDSQAHRLNILQAQAYFIKIGGMILKQQQIQVKKLKKKDKNIISQNSEHNFIFNLYSANKNCKEIAMIYNQKTYERDTMTEKQIMQILRQYLIKGIFHLILKIESRSLNDNVSWINVMRKHTFTKMMKCIESKSDLNSKIITIKNQKHIQDQILKQLLQYVKLFVDREALKQSKARTWKKNPVTQTELKRVLNKQLRAMKYDIIKQ